MKKIKFIDLFAGIGGFHEGAKKLGHECVFASEIEDDLRDVYEKNFGIKPAGDIRKVKNSEIPNHDLLMAGFPCQPFSKAGKQAGWNAERLTIDNLKSDYTGSLFGEIVRILKAKKPKYVLLENVGNFDRHDDGNTWKVVKETIINLGYKVVATEQKRNNGIGLISPHKFAEVPHVRGRFFIVGVKTKKELDALDIFKGGTESNTTLDTFLKGIKLDDKEKKATSITKEQLRAINHWNKFLKVLKKIGGRTPTVPIWGDEFYLNYSFEDTNPFKMKTSKLQEELGVNGLKKQELLNSLPTYARAKEFPKWKKDFIRNNREFWRGIEKKFDKSWIEELKTFPHSFRKFEWNCMGEELDIWKDKCIQLRPSGIRVRRNNSVPALVSLSETQVPILGNQKRFLTVKEGLKLQGFDTDHILMESRVKSFKALGNAVNAKVVEKVLSNLINT
tara:strand:+ start:125 stop:1465 length:1341 start_codon:yes stop_codon:yes gene_type:complete